MREESGSNIQKKSELSRLIIFADLHSENQTERTWYNKIVCKSHKDGKNLDNYFYEQVVINNKM